MANDIVEPYENNPYKLKGRKITLPPDTVVKDRFTGLEYELKEGLVTDITDIDEGGEVYYSRFYHPDSGTRVSFQMSAEVALRLHRIYHFGEEEAEMMEEQDRQRDDAYLQAPANPVTAPLVRGEYGPYEPREDMLDRIANDFTYHPPFGTQTERYVAVRDACRRLALTIVYNSPASREQSLALTALDSVMMLTNAAIARNEKSDG